MTPLEGASSGARSRDLRLFGGVALALFIALVWLNQGASLSGWKDRAPAASAIETLARPFAFLYRRALDEEMYHATASAVLGRPYDRSAFAIRGASSLPPIDVPADGRFHRPYAEVPFEYPPPNVPFIVLPRLFAESFLGYARLFGALMGLVLVFAAWIAAGIADREPVARARRLVVFSLLLLAHGALAIQRLDALVALLLVLVVDAAVRGHDRRLGFWAGLVFALKIVPAAVAIAVVVAAGVRAPARLGRIALGGIAGAVVGLGPMLVLAPEAFAVILRYHGARGLHVESSLGVLYGAAKALGGAREPGVLDYGSFNFHGAVAGVLASASPVVLVVLLGAVLRAAWPSRGESADRRDLPGTIVLAAIAATCAIWLGSKVFSPQYLTWLLPLAIAVPDRLLTRVALGLGVVLLLSQLYYRGYYDHVYEQRPLGIATMVTRLGVLGALYGFVVGKLRSSSA